MIQFLHESEFRERRQMGERRRMKQARPRGEGESSSPDYLFANRRATQSPAEDGTTPRALDSSMETMVIPRNHGGSSFRITSPSELRWQAEETIRLEALLNLCEALSPEATREILHELQMHQIKLQMQNEELHREQLKLESEKSRYFDLYDLAPVGYCIVNEKRLITEANLTVSGLLGESRNRMIKRPISKFILPEDQDIYYQNLKVLFEKRESQRFDLRMLKTDGTIFWANMECSIATEGAGLCRIAINDISERKRLEAENRQLQKIASLDRMAGVIAHLFNNQLQAVMSSLDLLEELPRGSDATKYLNMGKRASERAADVSRLMLIYIGQSTSRRELRSLAELCQASMPTIHNLLPETVTLETDWPSSCPLSPVNSEQIEQVITHLVTNALESMDEKKGTLRLSLSTWAANKVPTAHRFPTAWKPQDPSYICLEVADTGCGIASTDMEKLFDPFYTTKFTGRGLGLAMVLGIVHAHGAAITVESTKEQGSTFRIFFPIAMDTSI